MASPTSAGSAILLQQLYRQKFNRKSDLRPEVSPAQLVAEWPRSRLGFLPGSLPNYKV